MVFTYTLSVLQLKEMIGLDKIYIHIKKSLFLYLYFFSMLLLLPGLYKISGFEHFDKVLIHIVSFLVFFFLFYFFVGKKIDGLIKKFKLKSLNSNNLKRIDSFLFYFILIFITFHLLLLGRLPLIDQFKQTIIEAAAFVRQNLYKDMPWYLAYLMSFVVKAIIPFYLFYCLISKNYLKFLLILIVSVFYLLNLLQKNFIVFALMPSVIFLIFNKRFAYSIVLIGIIIVFIFTLIYGSNPHLRGHIQPDQKFNENKSSLTLASSGIIDRIFFVPGKVASVWFTNIPKKYPFLYGNGYNFWAKLTGKSYIDYSKELYKEYYPQYAKKGLQGTVNTAGFIVDYSNLGYLGLMFSGIIIGFWFVIIGMVFNNYKNMFVLNFTNVILLNSGYITTILLSGGWMLTIILYLILNNKFEEDVRH